MFQRRVRVAPWVSALHGVETVIGKEGNAGSSGYKRLITGPKARLPLLTHNLSIHQSAEEYNFLVSALHARSDRMELP